MAISGSNVKESVLRFSVDAPGVQTELNKIKDSSKSTAEKAVDAFKNVGSGISDGFKGIKGAIGVLGNLNQALELAGKAMQLVADYGDKLDMKAAAAGVSFEGLSKAARGLKTDMQLLEHAATLSRGAFKLNQQQLETVEKAMFALEEEGRDSAEVWRAMEAALTKGVTRPLEQMGIIIDTTGLKMDENGIKVDKYGERQAALAKIMEALAGKAKEAEGATLDEADAMQASVVQLQNYWDNAKEGLAKLVLQLKPLIDGLAKAVEYATWLASKLPGAGARGPGAAGFAGGLGAYASGGASAAWDHIKLGPLALPKAGYDMLRGAFGGDSGGGAGATGDPALAAFIAQFQSYRAPVPASSESAIERAKAIQKYMLEMPDLGAEIDRQLNKAAGEQLQRESAGSFDLGVDYSRETELTLGGAGSMAIGSRGLSADVKMSEDMLNSAGQIDEAMHGVYDSLLTVEERYANWMADQPTLLEKLGLDQSGLDGLELAKSAIAGFTSSYIDAMREMGQAIAEGNADAGEMLKKIAGGTIATLGDELLARGAAEAVTGGAMLLTGNPAGGLHLGAAALYTAGGVAAHAAASAIMGGSSQSKVARGGVGTAASAGASGGAAGGGYSGQPRSGEPKERVIVYAGDAWGYDSPRMRRMYMERAVEDVFGPDSGSNR